MFRQEPTSPIETAEIAFSYTTNSWLAVSKRSFDVQIFRFHTRQVVFDYLRDSRRPCENFIGSDNASYDLQIGARGCIANHTPIRDALCGALGTSSLVAWSESEKRTFEHIERLRDC